LGLNRISAPGLSHIANGKWFGEHNKKGLHRSMRTIALLTVSNIFMTFAWYGHLKYRNVPLYKVILVSWLIAFF
jgi:hypothetical protein